MIRTEQCNLSSVKGVGGGGVFESQIDFSPGLRVHFGKDGSAIVVFLNGGTKKRQTRDIADAQACWQGHKQRT